MEIFSAPPHPCRAPPNLLPVGYIAATLCGRRWPSFICEYDAAPRIHVAANGVMPEIGVFHASGSRSEISILHALYVILRFAISGHAVSAVHRPFASIVRCQS